MVFKEKVNAKKDITDEGGLGEWSSTNKMFPIKLKRMGNI